MVYDAPGFQKLYFPEGNIGLQFFESYYMKQVKGLINDYLIKKKLWML